MAPNLLYIWGRARKCVQLQKEACYVIIQILCIKFAISPNLIADRETIYHLNNLENGIVGSLFGKPPNSSSLSLLPLREIRKERLWLFGEKAIR